MLIIEVSNPSAPRLIAILDTEGWAHDLVIRPPLAFIADRQNGLVIADISRPEQPSVIGGFLPNQNSGLGTSLTFGVAVVQNQAYLTDTKSSFIEGEPPPFSLSVLDITNPAEPQLLGGYYSGGEAVAIAVDSARVAFLALGDMGIQAVDVRQPQSPQLLARYEKAGSVQDLVVQDDFGYAALGTGGLGVFSLPDGPQEVRTLRLSAFEQARSVAANLNRLYVGKNTNAISVFDITQPETPVPLRDLPLPAGIGQDLAIDAIAATPEALLAGYTNSAQATGGLLIWRLLSPDSIQFMSGLQLSSSVHQLRIEGDLAILAAGAGGAVIVDVQDARSPKVISQIPADDFVRDAAALQGLLGIADGQAGFRLFDVKNPGQPQPLGQFPTSGSTYGVFMENDTAYLANFFGPMALTLLNIRNPQQPERIEIHDTPGFAIKILKHKNQLFVVDTYDLAIFQTGITGIPRPPRRENSNSPLHMLRVYPNPFNPQTRVEFMLASAAHVSLIIYNASGQQIREIIAPTILPAGKHITTWDGRDDAGRKVSSGVYICNLRFNRFHQSQKILFIQ
ncbi:MAG: T9SS C-terminal target domain-containing protein [Calditrichaeota bacterium]|nr:MAG: T9SS C-terminal target domain-containing protein [Calditrichota bacterium]